MKDIPLTPSEYGEVAEIRRELDNLVSKGDALRYISDVVAAWIANPKIDEETIDSFAGLKYLQTVDYSGQIIHPPTKGQLDLMARQIWQVKRSERRLH